VALINSTKEHIRTQNQCQERQTQPGLVAFYDIRPRNGADLFLRPRSPHGADVS